MRVFVMLLALCLAMVSSQAYAELAGSESSRSKQAATETPGLLVLAQAGAERAVRQVPAGLTNAQVWGIAAGIVAAAFIADVAGLSGLGTLALAAAGGALGNWLLSEPVVESFTPDED